MSIDKKKFIKVAQAHLTSIEHQLNKELAMLSNRSWHETTKFLLIEYDSSQFDSQFSVSLWAMDERGNSINSNTHDFLMDNTIAIPVEIYDYDNYANDEEWDEVDPWATASTLIEQWFAQQWSIHTLINFPAYIGHHDSYFKTELSNLVQIDWDAILKRAQTR
ncbi:MULTISPECIES: hypothetical protein [Acinetobacter]|uniref:hypothetical protein n=1 Tax=Acinetobacter TaxID=469 RepID=UPI0005C6930D|nr:MULTISPECIES: hypothetical protein [Acinetobacter]